METPIPFKTRVCKDINDNAKVFKAVFIEYEYLLCSHAFKNHFHIVKAHAGNYLHLTGVNTHLNPEDFFQKAYNNEIRESDFNFVKPGVSEKSVKGSVREKIIVLPYIADFFSQTINGAEGFLENKISGTFSTSCDEIKITLGFISNGNPMSLLKGNKLKGNIQKVDLVFRRPARSNKAFSEIILGDSDKIDEYLPYIQDLIK